MHDLKSNHAQTSKELEDCNISVTQNKVERLDLQSSSIKREHQSVDRIKSALGKHGNLFSIEGNLSYNLSTQTFIPNENV